MILSLLCVLALSETQPTPEPVAPPESQAAAQESAVAPPVEKPSIWDKLKIDFNGRLRAESTFDQLDGTDRHRGRMRARLGAVYSLTDTLRAAARLSTESDNNDPNNPHWDFGDGADGFTAANIAMDRFYLEWDSTEDLRMQGGKFAHVYARPPVAGEFVWDEDVQPAGVSLQWKPGSDGSVRFDLRAAGYVAVENGSDDDPAMLGAQANMYLDASSSTQLLLSSSFSDWSSLGAGSGVTGNQGNTDVTGDFSVWDTFLSATWKGGPLQQLVGFGQFIKNVEADTDEDTGVVLGAQLGTNKKKGDFNVFAAWYDLDADSLFSPVAQDDTPIAGTGTGQGMQGFLAGGQYVVADSVALKLWVLTSDADDVEDPYRLRFDIDFKIP